jgi:glycerophosphoryl diester phosphodiesterase
MFKMIAHRGASKEAPENTISAVKRALALGCYCVEIDVRLSKEGIPVLLHDEDLLRVTQIVNAPSVHLLSLSEIQAYDVGVSFDPAFKGERVPTLAEVLDLEWKDTNLMIELKECPQQPKTLVEAVYQVILNASKKTRPSILFVGSFSLDIMREVREHEGLSSIVQTMGIVEEPEMVGRFVAQNFRHLAIWHPLITSELMQSLKLRNIEVWTFTVDDPALAKELVAVGVSGIISNDPNMYSIGGLVCDL